MVKSYLIDGKSISSNPQYQGTGVETRGENASISMYKSDAPANTPHRPGPGKATVQRLRCRTVSQPAPAHSLVFAGV